VTSLLQLPLLRLQLYDVTTLYISSPTLQFSPGAYACVSALPHVNFFLEQNASAHQRKKKNSLFSWGK